MEFSIGESADYLWDLNHSDIENKERYEPLVDDDPTTPDSYSRTDVYPPGEAFPIRTVVSQQHVHATGLLAWIIAKAEGDEVTETEVALMADQVALLLWEAVGTSAP